LRAFHWPTIIDLSVIELSGMTGMPHGLTSVPSAKPGRLAAPWAPFRKNPAVSVPSASIVP